MSMGPGEVHTGHRSRLKAEFRARGLTGWPDHRVLELVLCYAIPRGDVNPLAHRLIERFGDLAGVLDAPWEELEQVPGMGEHSAVLLKLLPQVCGRYLSQVSGARAEEMAEKGADYARLFYPYFVGATNERCCVLSLDARQKVLGVDLVSEGSVGSVPFDRRRLLEAALRHNARGVVLAHNHVGAYAVPSRADVACTEELTALLHQADIDLVDHLIFSGEEYVSLFASRWRKKR